MKTSRAIRLLPVLAALLSAEYTPSPANLEARRWFQEARFGLFIHWGVYSVLGDGEWVMNNRKISIAEYEKLLPQFNPVKFDAAEWVRLAKDAGMRYITITSKHHDGFAMWDSRVSTWDIADRTPYKKDILKMLADECHKQGVKLFFYHSHLDWHHPDYYPRGRTGHNTGRPEAGDWYRYLDYMDAQIRELLTGYGPIAGIWFDGWWDRPKADWRLRQTYDLIHSLQPAALIGNNHHQPPFEGEDFQMFEKDLPGQNTAGFNAEAKIGALPLETCETINRAWGYNQSDHQYKSTRDLIHYLVRAAGHNANFLLNVGPRPDGAIQPEFVQRLRDMGVWLRANGESIYGTTQGPIPPRDWGVTTRKGNRVYVHVLKLEDDVLGLPKLPSKVARATRLNGGPVAFTENNLGILLQLPLAARDAHDTIVALDLQ